MLKAAGQFTSRSHVLTLLVPSGSDVTAKRYRGTLRSVPPYAGASVRDTVNVLPMDSYVRGVVPYEMPASWDAAALRSQAVAARTYAAWLRAQNPRRYYQICDTTSCQVYGGVAAEQTSSNDAVTATAGKILTYQGKPAFTQFSSSSGGWTSKGSVPYLPAKKDPYDNIAMNANHSWKVVVSARSLERSHPEIGTLRDLRVTSREGHGEWGGRVLQIVLHGSQGQRDDDRRRLPLAVRPEVLAGSPSRRRRSSSGGMPSERPSRPSAGRAQAEYRLDNGSAQNFTQGRIYWSDKTGAREMMGPLLSTYRAFGGPASRAGLADDRDHEGSAQGHKIRLQGGYLFSKPGLGASVMFGPVLERWSRAEGGPSGHLGYPTSNVHAVPEGQRATFQHGTITWVRKTNTFRVVERD